MPLAPPWTLTEHEWFDHIWIDMRRRRQHSLTSHLETLLMHLLKWQYQPAGRQWGHSWADGIRKARAVAQGLLVRYPSLRPELPVALARAYPRARREAQRETGLSLATLPERSPWTAVQVLDNDFWPAA